MKTIRNRINRWACLFIFAMLNSCDIGDSIHDASVTLETTMKQYLFEINTTQNAILSGNGDVLELVKRLKETLGNIDSHLFYSVPYIERELTTSLTVTGLCSIEYLRLQAVDLLDKYMEEILTGNVSSRPKYPAFCSSNPAVLSLDAPIQIRRTINFVGFNLAPNRDSISVALVSNSGTKLLLKGALRFQGLFSCVIDLSGYPDDLLAKFNYIAIFYNGNKSLYEIPLLPKIPRPKETRTVMSKAIIGYVVPAHVFGNRDFSGRGPHGFVNVEFYLRRNKLVARIFMYAYETGCDKTTVRGHGSEYTLFECEPGWNIQRVSLPGFELTSNNTTRIFTTNFKDSNGALANAPFPTPIGQITVVGDLAGEEAGSRTRADVQFSSFQITIEKD